MTALFLAMLLASASADVDGGAPDDPAGSSTITEEPNTPPAPDDQTEQVPTQAVLPPMKSAGAAPVHGAQAAQVEGNAEFRAALEGGALTLPSGTPGGEQDFYAVSSPVVSFTASDSFAFTVGADLRFRVVDLTPKQTQTDYAGNLRREDWDELSDYGQILRELRIGAPGSSFELKAGELENVTLGLGHLVSRYGNRTDANYHPAGATLLIDGDYLRVQGMVSDLLAGRLFAADVRLDLGRVFGDESDGGRWHLSVSFLQDFGKGQILKTPQVTAMQIEPDAVVFDQQGQKVDLFLGIGTRIGEENNPPLGAVLGVRTDGKVHLTAFHGQIEVRKQQGRFRQGLVGPEYELARFADVGSSGPSIADAQLPDGWSFFADGQIDVPDPTGKVWMVASASGEHFTFDRTDVHGMLRFKIPGTEKVTGAMMVDAVGLGQVGRFYCSSELRVRFNPWLYGIANGGTAFFPQADNTLVHGFYGGFGIGMDFDSSRIDPLAPAPQ